MSKRNKESNKQNKRKDFNKKSFGNHKSAKHSGLNPNSTASTNPDRKIKPGSEGFYRTKSTIKRLNMYDEKPDVAARRKRPDKPVRIEPNRKWFGNTRTVNQKSLEELRREMENKSNDTYSLLLRKRNIPQSLITPLDNNLVKQNKLHQSYEETFGEKSRRTRPNLKCYSMEDYAKLSEDQMKEYDSKKDYNLTKLEDKELSGAASKYMTAGQSKRILCELYKVIDSSDVLLCILDARDPLGTRPYYVEKIVKLNAPHKHIVFVLNKCDLVPTWVTAKWIQILSKEYPTLAFHASINNPFGKPALFQILRQFDALHKDKKNISIGFIGYPNVGKSSVINTLKKTACCKSAPIPGETKVWQYISLTKRIYLIDCPGVVWENYQTETDIVLKGVLRAEKIEEPLEYIPGILAKAKDEYLKKIYRVDTWEDHEDFVKQIAKNYGKLLKGGEPDTKTMSKIILMDWQRGKIPFFELPTGCHGEKEKVEEVTQENENINEKIVEEDTDDKNLKYNIKQDCNDIILTNLYENSQNIDKAN